MTKATLLLDTRRRFDSTSLYMTRTRVPAARLLRLRAVHSGSARAPKTVVKLELRRPMAPLACAVEDGIQRRQWERIQKLRRAAAALISADTLSDRPLLPMLDPHSDEPATV